MLEEKKKKQEDLPAVETTKRLVSLDEIKRSDENALASKTDTVNEESLDEEISFEKDLIGAQEERLFSGEGSLKDGTYTVSINTTNNEITITQ